MASQTDQTKAQVEQLEKSLENAAEDIKKMNQTLEDGRVRHMEKDKVEQVSSDFVSKYIEYQKTRNGVF